jgi:UrcA family protein
MKISNKYLKTHFCAVAIAVVLAGALAVGSGLVFGGRSELSAPERVLVSYADLDVNAADGAAVLYHRIRVAAAEVCSIYDTRDLAQRALRQSCIDRAVVDAVAAVNNPVLSERYLANMKAVTQPDLVAAR